MWAALLLLCAGLLGAPARAASLPASPLEQFHFKSWMLQHQKKYSPEENHHRLQTFVSNWRKIAAHNAGNHTFTKLLSHQRGLPSQAFEYIKYNKGIMSEDTYPYKGQDSDCKFQPRKAIAFVKDVANITINDEEAMVEAVALYNPVSFAFEVTDDFMKYTKGIYSSTSCHKTPDKVNHAVLAVGYGEENGVPYWIVKNSWGPNWGMNGYFLIERGKNMCGLAACASYPIPLL
ncbi:Pro-Cathepsin H [Manis pentadactyla]|nr:Pro-Cathepsin H [Manis pentadactyla]